MRTLVSQNTTIYTSFSTIHCHSASPTLKIKYKVIRYKIIRYTVIGYKVIGYKVKSGLGQGAAGATRFPVRFYRFLWNVADAKGPKADRLIQSGMNPG